MRKRHLKIYFVFYSFLFYKLNAALCKNPGPSRDEFGEPTVIEYLQAFLEIRPHRADLPGAPDDSSHHRSMQPQKGAASEDDSTLYTNKYMMKYPRNQSFGPNCAYIPGYEVSRSRSLDGLDLSNGSGQFKRWGSDRDYSLPDLNELIEINKSSRGVLLVDFFATWFVSLCSSLLRCGPCSVMNQNLEVVRSHYRDDRLTILSIDVDRDERYLNEYEITALPSLLLFVKGDLYKKIVGLVDVKSLIKEIDNSLDSI
ncbi:uncharacterized protein TOT_010000413 [Theileria orientalis strain Shintoku]|uniref:Thioredoxin domain-containing protein n=1 Tax=Theileria orientalis strain Shintoku TaxID=869250 RepID=J4C7F5_THEOR|nr:uncharacterized protein TOT_010000413 [Theileria orientalis strain Shintoku]PVC53165.1 hypothetical protein MACL_00000235 [Theileria orientalis]BAM38948.1 uncharacterized protein TOT_010000413 [Theileria orientalis strain Shintoku]|eukprot:XP_009689249.1 uncharacterized protein TOT_010000413 [Theileria orientalis strain Shintoku]